jgi:hypothetical protein
MFTFVIAQRLGVDSDLTLGLSILEGVCLTVALMLVVERYLFSTTYLASHKPRARQSGAVGDVAAAADAGSGATTRTQS